VFVASADDGVSALDQMPIDVDDVILKAHGMDQRLLKFARIAGARLLVSVRDPKDSVVSQRERFDLSLQLAAMDISRTLATIGSLPGDLPVLRFAYEDGFTRSPETIARVAGFLGISVDDRAIAAIFDSLLPHRVRSQIDERLAALPAGADQTHDPVTHWHPQHIGDGAVGKWRHKLDPPSQAVVNDCLDVMMAPELRPGDRVGWSPELFSYNDFMMEGRHVRLSSDGAADYASWGPYMCLPRGRWRAVALAFSEDCGGPIIDADIFLPSLDQSLANCRTRLTRSGAPSVVLDFDHDDYFQAVEARLSTVEASSGSFRFSGWQLYWLGPLA
jgi:hypothetical protein